MNKPNFERPEESHIGLRRGAVSVGTTAIAWSIFSFVLYMGGHTPGGPTFLDPHYKIQAMILLPVLLVGWFLFAGVLWQLAGKRGIVTSRDGWFEGLGGIYGNGFFLGWVIPDAIAYWGFGFEALSSIVLFLPVATTAFVVYLSTQFIRRRVKMGLGGVLIRVFAAWCIQAVPILALIR